MESLKNFLEVVNLYGDAITALTTVVLAVLTYFLAMDNRQLRRAGTEPEVIAYLAPHPDGHGGINFVLANVGQGPAFKLKFELVCDERDFREHNVLLLNDPQRTSLTVLPQGEKFASLFGVGYVLFGKGADGGGSSLRPFTVKISYKDVRGSVHNATHVIDITQFSGMAGLLNKPAEREIADALNKMEKHLALFSRNNISHGDLLDATKMSSTHRQAVRGGDPDR